MFSEMGCIVGGTRSHGVIGVALLYSSCLLRVPSSHHANLQAEKDAQHTQSINTDPLTIFTRWRYSARYNIASTPGFAYCVNRRRNSVMDIDGGFFARKLDATEHRLNGPSSPAASTAGGMGGKGRADSSCTSCGSHQRWSIEISVGYHTYRFPVSNNHAEFTPLHSNVDEVSGRGAEAATQRHKP